MIYPDSPAIRTPTVAFPARRFASLLDQPDPALRLDLRHNSAAGHRRRNRRSFRRYRRWTPVPVGVYGEISTAAAIHPNASTVKTPAVALLAGRLAALSQQLHPASRIRRTIMPLAIIGRTRNALRRATRTENYHAATTNPSRTQAFVVNIPNLLKVMNNLLASLPSFAAFRNPGARTVAQPAVINEAASARYIDPTGRFELSISTYRCGAPELER